MPSETRRCLHKSEYSGNLFQVGRLAQLARAPRLHRGCQGFESLIAHRIRPHDSLRNHEIFCFALQRPQFCRFRTFKPPPLRK